MFIVDDLPDGFRVRGNAAATDWPVNLKLDIAYADGSRRPKWSEYDFVISKLKLTLPAGVAPEISKNSMVFRRCDATFEMEVRGFDSRRELVTNLRVFRDA
jgi:hypothetical protein